MKTFERLDEIEKNKEVEEKGQHLRAHQLRLI